jgi:hypothetical protein
MVSSPDYAVRHAAESGAGGGQSSGREPGYGAGEVRFIRAIVLGLRVTHNELYSSLSRLVFYLLAQRLAHPAGTQGIRVGIQLS